MSESAVKDTPKCGHPETEEEITSEVQSVFTTLEEAVSIIKERRKDPAIFERVRDFLNGDIPGHFDQADPILYLSRHIATPNYEALRFVELGKSHNLPLVIGQDRKGMFVPHNQLKHALGKLPVTTGYSHRQDEIIEYVTILDFNEANGKPIDTLTTMFGETLAEFHNGLFADIELTSVTIADETDWVDRNFRDDLLEQYKRMVALLCVHGIMFESYPKSELDLASGILLPAVEAVEEAIGYKPLIVEHIDEQMEMQKNWNGYPSIIYPFLKKKLGN